MTFFQAALAVLLSASKELLDEIDSLLGRYYELSEEELAFVVHYDGKYRTRGEE